MSCQLQLKCQRKGLFKLLRDRVAIGKTSDSRAVRMAGERPPSRERIALRPEGNHRWQAAFPVTYGLTSGSSDRPISGNATPGLAFDACANRPKPDHTRRRASHAPATIRVANCLPGATVRCNRQRGG